MAQKNIKKINLPVESFRVLSCCLLIVLASFAFARAADVADEEVSEKDIEQAEENEEKIEKYEEKLEKERDEKNQKEQKKLIISGEIGQLDGNISVIEEKIEESEEELGRIDGEIERVEKDIELQKKFLADILRKVNQADSEIELSAFNGSEGLGAYFLAVDSLQQLEEQLFKAVEEVKLEKEKFNEQKKEKEEVKEVRSDQKQTLEYEKNKKYVALHGAQQEINESSSAIEKIQSKISKLRTNISRLLGKGYDAKDIEDAAKFASKVTGVRKDFLMGMLVVESDLGRYTGGCNYKESRMNDHRKSIFKDICKELDYNYKKQKVSCPPSGYKGTGGAMGVAQFMSDTWRGYEDKIEKATGHSPPDPWSLTDGVTAMALKLGNDGATKKSGECNAAKRYLGGSHQWYCDKVQYWADHYEQLIN